MSADTAIEHWQKKYLDAIDRNRELQAELDEVNSTLDCIKGCHNCLHKGDMSWCKFCNESQLEPDQWEDKE